MNDYLQVLRIIQFCLFVALGFHLPETSRSMLLSIKDKIDFEIKVINRDVLPF